MSNHTKNLANPFSSGGGGHVFEIQVQTYFALLMLAGGVIPGLPNRSIKKIKLQGKFKGYDTDDFIAYASDSDQSSPCKLLAQIKRKFSFGDNDLCKEVIAGAWNDFQDSELFHRQCDAFAIITGPLSQTDIDSVRPLLERARSSEHHTEFFNQIRLANFSSDSMRIKLKVIRTHINTANGSEATDEEVWSFLRHLHLLGYDLDIKAGVIQAHCHSMIGFHTDENAVGVWGRILHEVMYTNTNAGTLSHKNFPGDLITLFEKPTTQQIPDDIAKSIAPSESTDDHSALSQYTEPLVLAAILGSWSDRTPADKETLGQLAKAFDDNS
jgi:hypothetical protein